MTGSKPGDLVDVAIKGVRVVGTNALTGAPTIVDEHGNEYPMPPQAAITQVSPAGWPPQPGDLWRGHDGRLWFAQVDPTPYESPLGVKLVSADGDSLHQNALGNGSGCTLVVREDQEPDR